METIVINLSNYAFPEELQNIGVHNDSVDIFMGKNTIKPLKVFGVRAPAANIIKQEMLSIGGDCAVNTGCVNCSKEISDIIILGTDRQYKRLIHKLKKMNYFGFPKMVEEIEKVLNDESEVYTTLANGNKITYEKTKVMGIINITPDSFYGGSRKRSIEEIVRTAEKMLEDGADLLDIGGESTRPGSEIVSEEDEIKRIIPAIAAIKKELGNAIISIDTYKSGTARAAIEAGVDIINDISAMKMDKNMIKIVKEYNVPIILMHMKGEPKNMQLNPSYDDLVKEVCEYFDERIKAASEYGITSDKTIIDPGIGFGKTVEHNLKLMQRMSELKSFKVPVLLATSRKSTIGKVLGDLPAEERLEGTIATSCAAVMSGMNMVRVHDVKENVRAIRMMEAIKCI